MINWSSLTGDFYIIKDGEFSINITEDPLLNQKGMEFDLNDDLNIKLKWRGLDSFRRGNDKTLTSHLRCVFKKILDVADQLHIGLVLDANFDDPNKISPMQNTKDLTRYYNRRGFFTYKQCRWKDLLIRLPRN